MDAWALYASGESSEPSQADHVTYIHHQPQEPGSLLPGRNQEAWSDFWTAEGDKMNYPFNVTDFQSGIHSEVLKLPSRMALSF